MSTAKLTILNGSILKADLSFSDSDLPLTVPKLLNLAESKASASLLNASLPESLKSAARRRINVDLDDQSFVSSKLSNEDAGELLVCYFNAIAEELIDNPVVVSTLDGAQMRLFLDDEDDFAMLAENLFTDLATEDVGKVRKRMVSDALEAMGVDFGIPPFAEFPMLNDILKKHGAEGEEEFGQAQFAEVLQHTMQELANFLAKKPLAVILHNVKVNNGSKLRKLLANEKQRVEAMEKILEEISNFCKKGDSTATEPELAFSKKDVTDPLRAALEKYSEELGIPPLDANDAVQLVHDAVFAEVFDSSSSTTSLEQNKAEDVIQKILEKYAEKLEANPVMYELLY